MEENLLTSDIQKKQSTANHSAKYEQIKGKVVIIREKCILFSHVTQYRI